LLKVIGRVIAVSVVALLTLSCAGVKADDLVGTWTMLERSRSYFSPELQSAAPQITLNADHTFIASDFPRRKFAEKRIDAVVSGRGTWKLLPVDGQDRVSLTFEQVYGDQLFISDWSTDPGSPTMLFLFLGDPDAGDRVLFARSR
jgi:hypothetical protein